MDQLLERLVGNKFFCFLDEFSGYFKIPIKPVDQEKTTFTFPYGTYAYKRMPFGIFNAPSTFQRCMIAIFQDMLETSIEVFMDDFSVFGDSFNSFLNNLEQMLIRCKQAHLVLNWEKCHFMVTEGIVLGHKVSRKGLELDKAKIDVIAKLPPPTNVKVVRKAGTTSTNLTAKLPILNLGDYDLWLMRIEQYFLMTDYSLWEVIKNGNKVLKKTVGETEQEYEPTTAEEKQDMRNEMKARGTLLMALPNKDQLKFYSYKDAKLLMEAIEKRYGRNKESKKFIELTQVNNMRTLPSYYTRRHELKTVEKSPSEWKTHALIWRNKKEIETISLDDLYNNLKIYELEISGSSSTSQNPQNVAFVSSNSSNSNSSTNEADNTAYGVSAAHTQSNPTFGDNLSDVVICAFLASQPNSPQISQEDLEQIDHDDLEKIDLQWEMAMLTIRARRFIKRTGRKLDVNGQRVGFDRSKVECYNCHKYDHFARECRALRNQESR
ncbi:ribonuclease H-like domain-containing protein [Tanacetum coccineum]